MTTSLTLKDLKEAVGGTAAAFRCVTEYQPAGGVGDKIFPATYQGGKYAVETRTIDGQPVQCVLLDSVQSQANRMELALLEAHRAKRISLPLLEARFDHEGLKKKFTVTSLEAPHRVADAIFRDSLLDGVIFRKSEKGKLLDTADVRNATGLYRLCPTALIFGVWDSTGPRGGLGSKFQRAMVSEMVGHQAQGGVRTSSRIDPAQIMLAAGPIYDRKKKNDSSPDWAIEQTEGSKKLGKDGKPSEANHSNIPPGISEGGYTISKAIQTTVLSLTALRRLRFPLNGSADSDNKMDIAARTVLAALSLTAAALTRDESADLRSRCHLIAQNIPLWELLDVPGEAPKKYQLTGNEAVQLFTEAFAEAKAAGLTWEGVIALTPHSDLVELVRRSQDLASASGEGVE